MSKKVKIRHPKTGHEREVFEQSVPHHVRAGWVLVKESPSRKNDNKEGGK